MKMSKNLKRENWTIKNQNKCLILSVVDIYII